MQSIGEKLHGNAYPGRGLLLGLTADGRRAVLAYFIMGRSANSRNRVFEKRGDTLTILPFDASKVQDPSLIIYNPVRCVGEATIVGNGDQTQTICDFLACGKSFEDALRTRCFEPDAPNWTPRISGMLTRRSGAPSYKLSILKCADGRGGRCLRAFYEYEPQAGKAHFISTYRCDGKVLPSYEGEPAEIETRDDMDAFCTEVWDALDKDNRISLYVRYIEVENGEYTDRLINQYH